MVLLTLVAVFVGWAVGVFASSSIVLPLLWAWPKARRLEREGQLTKPIPATMFIAAPLVWTVLLAGSVLLAVAVLPSVVAGYLIGLGIGFGQVARLVANPNQHMEADFAATYGAYLKSEVVPESEIEKDAAAVMKIVASYAKRLGWFIRGTKDKTIKADGTMSGAGSTVRVRRCDDDPVSRTARYQLQPVEGVQAFRN